MTAGTTTAGAPFSGEQRGPVGTASRYDYRYWVVPHTHWDREWYLPVEEFRLQLVRAVDELLDSLDADERLRFTLDGQAVVLDDYVEAHPERREQLVRLISEERIAVGPFYALPDEFIIGAETHVRNMIIGDWACRQYGGRAMRAGYVPDTFGHIAQLPQILRGFGLDNIIFQRGLGDETHELGAAFRWLSPDGSSVLALPLIDGYSSLNNWGRWTWNSGRFDDEPDKWTHGAVLRIKELVDKFHERVELAGLEDLLMCNGSDRRPVQPELPELVAAVERDIPGAKAHIATYEEYVSHLRGSYEPTTEFRGELTGGLEHQITRGVNSTRMYLKQELEESERALQVAEALASLAVARNAVHGPLTEGRKHERARAYTYPLGHLRLAWKELLKNTAHDSICGCSTDEVHRDMIQRFAMAQQVARAVQREALSALAGTREAWDAVHRTAERQSVVNALPWARREGLQLQLPEAWQDDVPEAIALRTPAGTRPAQLMDQVGPRGERWVAAVVDVDGFAGEQVELVREAAEGDLVPARVVDERTIENAFFRVHVLPNGSLEVTDLATGTVHRDLHVFEDCADRGDEYNFDALPGDTPWRSTDIEADCRSTAQGPVWVGLEISAVLPLPAELTEDRTARSDETVDCLVHTYVALSAGVDRIEFATILDNQASDHRLRVLFAVPDAGDVVRSEGHFETAQKAPDVTWGSEWIEKPAHTHHTGGMVTAGSVVAFTKGLREYETLRRPEGGLDLAITLLRGVGWLSRPDFASRPYNAGPMVPTPEAQCHGEHHFEYAISLRGDRAGWQLLRDAQSYRTDLVTGPEGADPRGLVDVGGNGWAFTALKGAEDGDGIVLRVFEPDGSDDARVLVTGEAVGMPVRTRLDESREDEHAIEGTSVPVRPYEIVTLRLGRDGSQG